MEDLDDCLLNFEKVIAAQLPYYMAASPIARAMREIYATRSASAVLSCVRTAFSGTAEITHVPVFPSSLRPILPTPRDIQGAAPSLLAAVASRNPSETGEALSRMGVFALCPSSDDEFAGLEYSVGSIVGRVRLIPLVELAILAAQFSFYEKAALRRNSMNPKQAWVS